MSGIHRREAQCTDVDDVIKMLQIIREWTPKLARALRVIGLINIQYVVQDEQVLIKGSVLSKFLRCNRTMDTSAAGFAAARC